MNLNQLIYFASLAQLQHVTRASEKLNIAQPSLSKAIANLEQELGVDLFEKQGRNVVLTRQGKPVSYTHLGAAGHQADRSGSAPLADRTGQRADSGVRQVFECEAGSGLDPARLCPVSYTHLDVYKRQPEQPARPHPARRCSWRP